MSKRKDPVDEAIAYCLNQPLAVATTFVQTLAAVVKARAAAMPAKPEGAPRATPAKGGRAAGPQRVVTERAPGAPVVEKTPEVAGSLALPMPGG